MVSTQNQWNLVTCQKIAQWICQSWDPWCHNWSDSAANSMDDIRDMWTWKQNWRAQHSQGIPPGSQNLSMEQQWDAWSSPSWAAKFADSHYRAQVKLQHQISSLVTGWGGRKHSQHGGKLARRIALHSCLKCSSWEAFFLVWWEDSPHHNNNPPVMKCLLITFSLCKQ